MRPPPPPPRFPHFEEALTRLERNQAASESRYDRAVSLYEKQLAIQKRNAKFEFWFLIITLLVSIPVSYIIGYYTNR